MGRGYPDTFIMNRAMREAQMTSASDDRIWRSYDSGLKELNNSLGPAFRAIGFLSIGHASQWLEERSGRRPTGLEIAGQGATFAQLKIEGVANCLAIPEFLIDQSRKTKHLRRRYATPPVTFAPGDIAHSSTWDEIRRAFQDEKIDPPNLILFTPAGGVSCMPEICEFYESILIRSLELTGSGPVVMTGEVLPAYSGKLEQRLISMQRRRKARVAILAGCEYGLFALMRP